MNPRTIIVAGSFLGLTSVVISAASDHLLQKWGPLHTTQVALHYQQLYAIVITGIGLTLTSPHFSVAQRRGLNMAAWLFIAGTALFCGGLYAAVDVAAAVDLAPVGGCLIMAAWAAVGLAFIRSRITPKLASTESPL